MVLVVFPLERKGRVVPGRLAALGRQRAVILPATADYYPRLTRGVRSRPTPCRRASSPSTQRPRATAWSRPGGAAPPAARARPPRLLERSGARYVVVVVFDAASAVPGNARASPRIAAHGRRTWSASPRLARRPTPATGASSTARVCPRAARPTWCVVPARAGRGPVIEISRRATQRLPRAVAADREHGRVRGQAAVAAAIRTGPPPARAGWRRAGRPARCRSDRRLWGESLFCA